MRVPAARELADSIEKQFTAQARVENRDAYAVVHISFTHEKRKRVKQTHRAIRTWLTENGYDDFDDRFKKSNGGRESYFLVRS